MLSALTVRAFSACEKKEKLRSDEMILLDFLEHL
jgi:hypothetical protein